MAIASNRGWPSSENYFKGGSPSTLEMETSSKHNTTQSEDEES